MAKESLQDLVDLSARIGGNLDLVQAGGGNTSIKEAGTLWVKASGKWLRQAAVDDMFLPVPMETSNGSWRRRMKNFPSTARRLESHCGRLWKRLFMR